MGTFVLNSKVKQKNFRKTNRKSNRKREGKKTLSLSQTDLPSTWGCQDRTSFMEDLGKVVGVFEGIEIKIVNSE